MLIDYDISHYEDDAHRVGADSRQCQSTRASRGSNGKCSAMSGVVKFPPGDWREISYKPAPDDADGHFVLEGGRRAISGVWRSPWDGDPDAFPKPFSHRCIVLGLFVCLEMRRVGDEVELRIRCAPEDIEGL